MNDFNSKNAYLAGIYSVVTVGNLIGGFSLGDFNQVSFVVKTQLEWGDSADLKITLINSFGVLGLMFGSLLAGQIVPIGRWKTIIFTNILSIVSSIPQLYLSFWTILFGKLGLGFAAGIMIVACSVWMKETVPAAKLSLVATSVNFGIVFGLFVTTLL